MAALDSPWMISMTDRQPSGPVGKLDILQNNSNGPTTTAAFSPHAPTSSIQQRSTILLHQKSPLLLATPPQVTRALAYSHGFLIPLNKIAGLLSWTTGDPWESFLFVAAFWFTALYGDAIFQYAGPLILVLFLILGMYYRRYSPLSSSGWTRGKKKSKSSGDSEIQHRKSLDEILATLQAFTGRCNILLAPMINMTDFLSTQQTATSATTRPALTTLFVRILFATPIWLLLTLPPLRVITGRRVIFVAGTLVLTWHSRPARISRAILWRSRTVRHAATLLTGLNFTSPTATQAQTSSYPPSNMAALREFKFKHQSIRFTFALYENQRRWIGLGWTSNMVAYERAPWTDEHLNATAPMDKFELPNIEGSQAKWRWVEGSSWRVDVPPASPKSGKDKTPVSASKRAEEAWIYYDNKWLNGTRGQDGWSRYTRRRKWIRDAELVDVDTDMPVDSTADGPGNSRDGAPLKRAGPIKVNGPGAVDILEGTATPKAESKHAKTQSLSVLDGAMDSASVTGSDVASPAKTRRSWFGKQRDDTEADQASISNPEEISAPTERGREPSPARSRAGSELSSTRGRGASRDGHRKRNSRQIYGSSYDSTGGWSSHSRAGSTSGMTTLSERERRRDEGQDVLTPTERLKQREADWGLGDDVSMGLG